MNFDQLCFSKFFFGQFFYYNICYDQKYFYSTKVWCCTAIKKIWQYTSWALQSVAFYAELTYCQTPTQLGTQLNLNWSVGVDFVFQCHKKNKNKKNNPHLILCYFSLKFVRCPHLSKNIWTSKHIFMYGVPSPLVWTSEHILMCRVPPILWAFAHI